MGKGEEEKRKRGVFFSLLDESLVARRWEKRVRFLSSTSSIFSSIFDLLLFSLYKPPPAAATFSFSSSLACSQSMQALISRT